MKKKSTHGGKRPGAGGKPLPPGRKRIKTSCTMPQEIMDYARESEGTFSEIVEEAIRGTRAFREWKKGKQ